MGFMMAAVTGPLLGTRALAQSGGPQGHGFRTPLQLQPPSCCAGPSAP